MAPPSHLAQFSTRALVSLGNSPASTWSANMNRPPGFRTRIDFAQGFDFIHHQVKDAVGDHHVKAVIREGQLFRG